MSDGVTPLNATGLGSPVERVLVVDQRQEWIARIRTALPHVEVAGVSGSEAAFRFLCRHDTDVLAVDPSLGLARVVELFLKMRHRVAGAQLLVVAGSGAAPPGTVAALQDLSFAELPRDAPADLVNAMIQRSLELYRGTPVHTDWPGIVGHSAALSRALARMENLRPTNRTVLFTGPAGGGKSLCAAALHAGGPRGARRFVCVACDRADPTNMEREIFGPKPGSFDDGLAPPGLLDRARGGTIFLDHVDRLAPGLQERIAAVIEGNDPSAPGHAPIDVRFLASTRDNLGALSSAQPLSRRLLQAVDECIEMPSLATRPEDIGPLASEFARRAALREGLPEPILSVEFLRALSGHTWEGNVRELRREVGRAVTLGRAGPPVPSRT